MSQLNLLKTLVVSTNGIIPSATPQIYFDGTNAIAANTFSVPILVEKHDRLGLQVSAPVTGAPNGSVALQGSNDESQTRDPNAYPDVNLVNWSTVSFFDELTFANVITKVFNSAQSYLFTVPNCSYRWMRMVWTNTSGSALLTARVQVKSLGGR
jgi:hypothetical protein